MHCCLFFQMFYHESNYLILQNKVDININEGILSFYLHNKTLCLDFLKISYFLFVVIWNIIVILGMWLSFITIKNELLIKMTDMPLKESKKNH